MIDHANAKNKKVGLAIWISDKIKTGSITKDREGNFIKRKKKPILAQLCEYSEYTKIH